MATLGDLRTRIIVDTNRDDLAGPLASRLDQAIQEAIEIYASSRFYFNEQRITSTLTLNSQWFTLPTTIIGIDRMWITVGAVEFELRRVSPVEMENNWMVISTGQPINFTTMENAGAYMGRVWPQPNIAYPATFIGITGETPLDYANAASSNVWTNQGLALIAARAEMMLYRSVFRDSDGYSYAQAAEQEAINSLRGDNATRMSTGRVRASW